MVRSEAGPVGRVLDTPDPYPLVAEPGGDAGVAQRLIGAANHDVGAVAQLARLIGVLIGDQLAAARARVVDGSQPGGGEQPGDVRHPLTRALAALVRGQKNSNLFTSASHSTPPESLAQPSTSRTMTESTRRGGQHHAPHRTAGSRDGTRRLCAARRRLRRRLRRYRGTVGRPDARFFRVDDLLADRHCRVFSWRSWRLDPRRVAGSTRRISSRRRSTVAPIWTRRFTLRRVARQTTRSRSRGSSGPRRWSTSPHT